MWGSAREQPSSNLTTSGSANTGLNKGAEESCDGSFMDVVRGPLKFVLWAVAIIFVVMVLAQAVKMMMRMWKDEPSCFHEDEENDPEPARGE